MLFRVQLSSRDQVQVSCIWARIWKCKLNVFQCSQTIYSVCLSVTVSACLCHCCAHIGRSLCYPIVTVLFNAMLLLSYFALVAMTIHSTLAITWPVIWNGYEKCCAPDSGFERDQQTCQWDRVDNKCTRKPTRGGNGVGGCTMEIVCAAEDEAGQCRRFQDTWELSALSTLSFMRAEVRGGRDGAYRQCWNTVRLKIMWDSGSYSAYALVLTLSSNITTFPSPHSYLCG